MAASHDSRLDGGGRGWPELAHTAWLACLRCTDLLVLHCRHSTLELRLNRVQEEVGVLFQIAAGALRNAIVVMPDYAASARAKHAALLWSMRAGVLS